MSGTRTLVIVPHTHWDREWYQPFEEFRARLVGTMERLLDLLDRDPEFRCFVVDGQTVPIDDFLEIRPERRPDIERLVREGRLLIGPNYVLPDEFLIGGESWVRNLMVGIRSARDYGGAMMVGYSPDAFGHIAHLPAVLRGFGIDSVLIWRGVGRSATTSEFRWRAPDGSEVLAIHFPYGYGMLARIPEDRQALANALRNVRTLLEPLATTRYVLVPNGTDHLPAHEGLSQVIRTANEILDDAEVVHGNYAEFAQRVRRELGDRYDSLPLLEGEFRDSSRSNILPGVLSTRMWLKQRYQQCEDLLARYAEPAAAWAHLLRREDGAGDEKTRSDCGLLRHAWRLLLQNGPHDSVTGCSADAVYDDVSLRFQRCQQVGETVLFESLRYLAERAAPPGGTGVLVFNPEHGPRTDFCTVRLPVENGMLPAKLVDGEGEETPVQIVERGGYSPLDARERVVAGFVARDLPAFGYRAYRVQYGDAATIEAPGPLNLAVENEFFRVEANPDDGTLAVEEKRTGRRLNGLNRFLDGGDRGDEYTYDPPLRDEVIERPARPPEIRVTEVGPARLTLELRMVYALPERLTPDRDGRAQQRVECEIVTRAHLYPGVPRVDIDTEVENRAEDHRLRVHFPSGLRTDRTHAEQHFGVVERPLAVPGDDGTWFETPVGTYPQKSFVDVSDGERGLIIANRGLPEYEALTEADGTITIALTLLRCVSWLSRSDLRTRRGHAGPGVHTPGAQMPGRWRFQYALLPHAGTWEQAYLQAHCFLRPPRAVRTSRGAGSLPPQGSLLDLKPSVVTLSTAKIAEEGDGVVVRVYNIASHQVDAKVRLNAPFAQVERVNLNEEEPQPVDVTDGSVWLTVRRNEIATLKFKEAQR